MRTQTWTTLDRIINQQRGFLTDVDLQELVMDPAMHSCLVLMRRHSGRNTVTIGKATAAIDAAHDDLRDVSFPAAEHQDIARTLARRHAQVG